MNEFAVLEQNRVDKTADTRPNVDRINCVESTWVGIPLDDRALKRRCHIDNGGLSFRRRVRRGRKINQGAPVCPLGLPGRFAEK